MVRQNSVFVRSLFVRFSYVCIRRRQWQTSYFIDHLFRIYIERNSCLSWPHNIVLILNFQTPQYFSIRFGKRFPLIAQKSLANLHTSTGTCKEYHHIEYRFNIISSIFFDLVFCVVVVDGSFHPIPTVHFQRAFHHFGSAKRAIHSQPLVGSRAKNSYLF